MNTQYTFVRTLSVLDREGKIVQTVAEDSPIAQLLLGANAGVDAADAPSLDLEAVREKLRNNPDD